MRLVLARSYPVVQRTRAVASRMASTVACDRSWRGFFRGVVRGRRCMGGLSRNASCRCERSLAYSFATRRPPMQALNRALDAARGRIAFARTLWSFVDLVKHPDHLDRVFEISDGMVKQRMEVLGKMAEHFARDERGARALAERRRLHVDLAELSKLPAGTLGRVFAEHMIVNELDPASIPTLAADDALDFVRAHLYETHDVWHAVTGFQTDVP